MFRRSSVAFLLIFGGCISALIVKVKRTPTNIFFTTSNRQPDLHTKSAYPQLLVGVPFTYCSLPTLDSGFKAHHQAATASSARRPGFWHAIISRSFSLFLCHFSCRLSASHRRCNILDVCARLLARFYIQTDTKSSFAVDACFRRYQNRQHSVAQLALGCAIGIINCSLTALTIHSNATAVTQFDVFLKSTQGK